MLQLMHTQFSYLSQAWKWYQFWVELSLTGYNTKYSPLHILGTATTDTHAEDRYTKKTSMVMIHSIVSFRTFFRVGCFKSKLCLYVINIIPSSLRRYFLLTEVTPFHTAMKFISIPLGNMTKPSKNTLKKITMYYLHKGCVFENFHGCSC